MEIQKLKQTVYLPVKVEDELPSEYTRISLSMDGGKTFPFETSFVKWLDYKKEGYTHWLKQSEGYFFTPEQLNEYTQTVIKQALEVASDGAKIPQFKSRFLTIQENKQSITNTFDETFKQFKV